MPWFAETEFPRPGPSRRSAWPAKSGPNNDIHKEAHGNHKCCFAQTALRFNVKVKKRMPPTRLEIQVPPVNGVSFVVPWWCGTSHHICDHVGHCWTLVMHGVQQFLLLPSGKALFKQSSKFLWKCPEQCVFWHNTLWSRHIQVLFRRTQPCDYHLVTALDHNCV